MTSGYLTWGEELDEGLDGSDTMPFPRGECRTDFLWRTPHWGGTTCLT
jgi:hypothetical protein